MRLYIILRWIRQACIVFFALVTGSCAIDDFRNDKQGCDIILLGAIASAERLKQTLASPSPDPEDLAYDQYWANISVAAAAQCYESVETCDIDFPTICVD